MYAIFGATGGIGSELARRLAAQPGAHVLAAANTKDSLNALSDEVKDLLAVECDVLKRDSVRRGLRPPSGGPCCAVQIRQAFVCLWECDVVRLRDLWSSHAVKLARAH